MPIRNRIYTGPLMNRPQSLALVKPHHPARVPHHGINMTEATLMSEYLQNLGWTQDFMNAQTLMSSRSLTFNKWVESLEVIYKKKSGTKFPNPQLVRIELIDAYDHTCPSMPNLTLPHTQKMDMVAQNLKSK